MGVECCTYEVAGLGVGEVWLRGETLVHHEILWARGAAGAQTSAAGTRLPTSLSRGASPETSRAHAEPPLATNAERPFPPDGGATSPSGTIAEKSLRVGSEIATSLCRRFHSHLRGRRVEYADVVLDLDWCSPFERELALALRTVAWGEVVTYGELAGLAGRPRAARAAGTFCAGNRFALVLPCHRVIAANGIGGYGSDGVPVKRRLLALEGVNL